VLPLSRLAPSSVIIRTSTAVTNTDQPLKPIAWGELQLWREVLLCALDDLRRSDPARRRDAQAWITSNRKDAGSFLWVCAVLDVDAATVRRRFKSVAREHAPLSVMK
jgi:hypothetical protein